MLRLIGDVLLATGDPAAAEASYREAIAIAQQQSAKLWELRAAKAPALVPRQPHAQSGDSPKTPGPFCSSARRRDGLQTKAASPGD
jgi:hypothetical protein